MTRAKDVLNSTMSDSEWNKLHKIVLDAYQVDFENGNSYTILKAIKYCGNEQIIMPEWLVDAFYKITNKFNNFEVKTLDEAFGFEWPKGMHLNKMKKKRNQQFKVYFKVCDYIKSGNPIDDNLFDKVGDEFHIGKSLVKDYYYDQQKRMGCDINPIAKKLMKKHKNRF